MIAAFLIHISITLMISNAKEAKERRISHNVEDRGEFRVVGGTEASVEDFPFIVSIQKFLDHICGGSIVTEKFVLTAAHCVIKQRSSTISLVDPTALSAVAGQTILEFGESQSRNVKEILIHSGFSKSEMINDISLLEIIGVFQWTKTTSMAALRSTTDPEFGTYQYCTALGWGYTKPLTPNDSAPGLEKYSQLQQVDLQPCSQNVCMITIAKHGSEYNPSLLYVVIKDSKDVCYGDSGGPFICNGILYGLTSYGMGCAQTNMLGVFTNIFAFHKWISGVINQTETSIITRAIDPKIEKTDATNQASHLVYKPSFQGIIALFFLSIYQRNS